MTDTADDRTGDRGPAASLPEFRIVVRRPNSRGPLAPYRLLITVAVVMVVFGGPLYRSVMAGMPDDAMLLRAAGLGLLVWITTGIVSAAIGAAEQAPPPPTD